MSQCEKITSYLYFLYCGGTHYHKLSGLEQHTLLSGHFYGAGSRTCLSESSAQGLKGWNQGANWVMFFSGAWGHLLHAHSCWWNSVPCSCRTEIPVFLLAASQGSPIFLTLPLSSNMAASFLKAASKRSSCFFHPLSSDPLDSVRPTWEKSPFWWTWSQLIRDLHYICKISLPLPYIIT